MSKKALDVAAMVSKAVTAVLKDAGVGDVHQTTALGNDDKKDPKDKKKTFLSTIDDAKAKADTVDVDKDWSVPFQVAKVDTDQRLVFGWASISTKGGEEIVDKQGDVVAPDELEKAAYNFVLHSRSHGGMHVQKFADTMVESMVFTKQKQDLLGIDLGLEGWWVGFSVPDDAMWKSIKGGNLPEFSIGGRGKRTPVA